MKRLPVTIRFTVALALLVAIIPLSGAPALAREKIDEKIDQKTDEKIEEKAEDDTEVKTEEKADEKVQQVKPADEWDSFVKTILGFRDLAGRVSARRLTYKSFPPATDLSGRVRITKGCWHFEAITADMCGGDVSAEAAIDFLEGRRRFRLRANVENALLGDLTRFYDYSVMGGFISGRFEMSATSVKGSLHGSAEFHVRGGDLGRFPIALKVVSFIFLDFPRHQKEIISEADGHVTLTPRGLVFQDLSLRSETGAFSLEAERNGRIDYKGEIDLYFRPVFEEGLTKVIPGLPEIIDAIRGRGGRVRVTGTIKEPKFKWGAFR